MTNRQQLLTGLKYLVEYVETSSDSSVAFELMVDRTGRSENALGKPLTDFLYSLGLIRKVPDIDWTDTSRDNLFCIRDWLREEEQWI